MTAFLIWLFGAATLGAACNFFGWARLVRRWFYPFDPDRRGVYLISRIAITLTSVGLLFGSWARASGLVVDGARATAPITLLTPWFDIAMPGWTQGLWMGCLLLGEIGMLLSAALHALETERRPIGFVVFLVGLALWSAFVGTFWL